ncbi:hypothetical protein BOTBODRAFT_187900 [Botryobasidium botryosum FD-172 SS1]|uniref:Uncharacterized protein n=1 Tax=Botryobasidium botryosum (strain FD-172 SS1) TaxID=930990 RepID=A0A067MGC6_BOTB1|nr:hypothetical protein BOTBODRAFT_187900 [Botryobasidium botryosum FD-172 SS1]
MSYPRYNPYARPSRHTSKPHTRTPRLPPSGSQSIPHPQSSPAQYHLPSVQMVLGQLPVKTCAKAARGSDRKVAVATRQSGKAHHLFIDGTTLEQGAYYHHHRTAPASGGSHPGPSSAHASPGHSMLDPRRLFPGLSARQSGGEKVLLTVDVGSPLVASARDFGFEVQELQVPAYNSAGSSRPLGDDHALALHILRVAGAYARARWVHLKPPPPVITIVAGSGTYPGLSRVELQRTVRDVLGFGLHVRLFTWKDFPLLPVGVDYDGLQTFYLDNLPPFCFQIPV